jgi:hypothetical protein
MRRFLLYYYYFKIKEDVWAGHVARIAVMRDAYRVLVGNLKGKNNSRGLGVDGRIILKCFFLRNRV